ncbi:MAG: hypothetical protein FH752_05800 [Marinobacter adhaerens]|jgi:hypothetical protein|uniref:Uncharacterized protein n=1 Tax=Marinobacter adhaerens TaxID=1033846 RepID=A0A844I297_9GAMM|nr:hypothetical protein [Marinobacter adhaerens]
MPKSSLSFETQRDIAEVAEVLIRLNNISQGRDLVWLLNQQRARDNFDAVALWLRNEVWKRQRNREDVDISTLSNALQTYLTKALMDLE